MLSLYSSAFEATVQYIGLSSKSSSKPLPFAPRSSALEHSHAPFWPSWLRSLVLLGHVAPCLFSATSASESLSVLTSSSRQYRSPWSFFFQQLPTIVRQCFFGIKCFTGVIRLAFPLFNCFLALMFVLCTSLHVSPSALRAWDGSQGIANSFVHTGQTCQRFGDIRFVCHGLAHGHEPGIQSMQLRHLVHRVSLPPQSLGRDCLVLGHVGDVNF